MQRLDALDHEQAAMHQRLPKVEGERDRYRELYQETMERCRKLEKGLMGQHVQLIRVDDANNVIAFRRWMDGGLGDDVVVMANFHRDRREKFEIGFPLPEKRGAGEVTGYHCWAKFLPAGKGWVPVDISEANKNPKLRDYYFGHLTEDRVCFSTGRDLDLVPKQDGPPVNFFVYPYVEVAGKPYPQEKVQKKFSFADAK